MNETKIHHRANSLSEQERAPWSAVLCTALDSYAITNAEHGGCEKNTKERILPQRQDTTEEEREKSPIILLSLPLWCLVSVVSLLFLPVTLIATPGYHEPWGKDADLLPTKEEPFERHPSFMVKAARQAILFHQNVLTQVDGPRSHFRPSSSQYMLLAMYKHGFVTGFFLGCERLLRENDDPWVYKTIPFDGKLMKYNPVP